MSTQFDYSVQVYSPFMTCWPPLLPPQPKTHIPLETLIKQKGFTCFQNSTERKRVMVSSRGLMVGVDSLPHSHHNQQQCALIVQSQTQTESL